MATIDVHAHLMVLQALYEMRAAHPDIAPEVDVRDEGVYLRFPGRMPLGPRPIDLEGRLADMDRQRVDIQTASIPPPQYHYHVEAAAGVDFARIQNDGLISVSDTYPDRLHVLATLPLQDIEASIAELRRVSEHPRVRGVQIGTNVNGTNLDDHRFEPLWSALASEDLPILIHPDQRDSAGKDRLQKYFLVNFIGNPVESTIAIASLVFGGVLARHPELRFGFVHGGGFAPYQTGRWDHGWTCRPEAKEAIAEPPTTYFNRLFFDSLTHDALSLEMLGRRVGWRQVFVGSDYPADMASDDPVGAVQDLGLSAEDETAVLAGNAERFLRPVDSSAGPVLT